MRARLRRGHYGAFRVTPPSMSCSRVRRPRRAPRSTRIGTSGCRARCVDGAAASGHRTARHERPCARRPDVSRGHRDRHGHALSGVDRGRAGRPPLDAQADRVQPRPLGSHRRQRRGRRAHRCRHRRPSARSRPADPSRAGLRPVRDRRRRSRPSISPRAARSGSVRSGLRVLHTPGHTEGSVCLLDPDAGLLFSGDTLFAGGWGRVDLPGGDPDRDGRVARSTARPGRPRRASFPATAPTRRWPRAPLARARPRSGTVAGLAVAVGSACLASRRSPGP